MGVVILVIISIGIYIVLRAMFRVAVGCFKPRANVATESTQSVQPEVSCESSEMVWSSFEVPTFLRRGLPFPVLTAKVKAKRKSRSKLKAAAHPPEVDSFPMGDWTLFATNGGEHYGA